MIPIQTEPQPFTHADPACTHTNWFRSYIPFILRLLSHNVQKEKSAPARCRLMSVAQCCNWHDITTSGEISGDVSPVGAIPALYWTIFFGRRTEVTTNSPRKVRDFRACVRSQPFRAREKDILGGFNLFLRNGVRIDCKYDEYCIEYVHPPGYRLRLPATLEITSIIFHTLPGWLVAERAQLVGQFVNKQAFFSGYMLLSACGGYNSNYDANTPSSGTIRPNAVHHPINTGTSAVLPSYFALLRTPTSWCENLIEEANMTVQTRTHAHTRGIIICMGLTHKSHGHPLRPPPDLALTEQRSGFLPLFFTWPVQCSLPTCLRSCKTSCIARSLRRYGRLSLTYASALSLGKPVE